MKWNPFNVVKGIALFIPTVICILMLIVVAQKLQGTTTDLVLLELKMDSLIGIIGVAVSVWIGLNIYNVIERNQLEHLEKRIKELEKKLNKVEKKAEKPARFG